MPQKAAAVIPPALLLERAPVARPLRRDAVMAILAPLGIAFALVGFADLALTWYPLRIGSPEWEMGTIMQTLNGLPVPALGLVLLAARAMAGRRAAAVTIAVVLVLCALAIAGMGALLALSVPIALKAVQVPAIHTGLMKAVAKAAVQLVAFGSLFLWVAARALRKPASTSAERESA